MQVANVPIPRNLVVTRKREVKYNLQSNQLFGNITSTPQTLLLNGLQRGSGVQNRIGDYTKNVRFKLSALLTTGMAASPWSSAVRLMIICVKPSNYSTTLPLYAASPASGYLIAVSPPYIHSMYNFNNVDIAEKFSVLYDKVHFSVQNDPSIPTFEDVKIDIPLNTETSYKGGNVGTGADIDKNQYWLAAWTDNSTAGTNMRFDAAFFFYDE